MKAQVVREFLVDQIPVIVGVFILGVLTCHWQGGHFAAGKMLFPVAGVTVSIWHLLFLGVWTGYVMSVVGEASGILSLPYSVSILQFSSVGVSATTLITTFLNPYGALLGYYRNGQWNLDLALGLCAGAMLGAPLGPFIRIYFLSDPEPFKALTGMALFIMGCHLIIQVTPWYRSRAVIERQSEYKVDDIGPKYIRGGDENYRPVDGFRIVTVRKSLKAVTISFLGRTETFNTLALLIIGLIVGVVASTLGVGGGFILVPVMVIWFRLPLYVLVAATIPFVITLSLVGLFSYAVIVPLITGTYAAPDWGFGLFVACGAIFGAWLGSKTQRYIPEKFLKTILGGVTSSLGSLYVIEYFVALPFEI